MVISSILEYIGLVNRSLYFSTKHALVVYFNSSRIEAKYFIFNTLFFDIINENKKVEQILNNVSK